MTCDRSQDAAPPTCPQAFPPDRGVRSGPGRPHVPPTLPCPAPAPVSIRNDFPLHRLVPTCPCLKPVDGSSPLLGQSHQQILGPAQLWPLPRGTLSTPLQAPGAPVILPSQALPIPGVRDAAPSSLCLAGTVSSCFHPGQGGCRCTAGWAAPVRPRLPCAPRSPAGRRQFSDAGRGRQGTPSIGPGCQLPAVCWGGRRTNLLTGTCSSPGLASWTSQSHGERGSGCSGLEDTNRLWLTFPARLLVTLVYSGRIPSIKVGRGPRPAGWAAPSPTSQRPASRAEGTLPSARGS